LRAEFAFIFAGGGDQGAVFALTNGEVTAGGGHPMPAGDPAAKAAERNANEDRLMVEAAMLALMPQKPEGTVTDAETGVTCTYKVTRKANTDALQNDWMHLSQTVQSAFTWKADVSAKQIKAIQELDPAAFEVAAKYITSTPAKPSISIKE
jgi:hypothetical protein